jgi:hypothetical protein
MPCGISPVVPAEKTSNMDMNDADTIGSNVNFLGAFA